MFLGSWGTSEQWLVQKLQQAYPFFISYLLNYFVFVTQDWWSGYVIKLICEDQHVWMFMLVVPEVVTYYQSDVFLGLFNNFADNMTCSSVLIEEKQTSYCLFGFNPMPILTPISMILTSLFFQYFIIKVNITAVISYSSGYSNLFLVVAQIQNYYRGMQQKENMTNNKINDISA